jgi:hypothetical protein
MGVWKLLRASGRCGARQGDVAVDWELWRAYEAGWLLPAVTQDRRGHHIIILYSVVQDHAAHAPKESN